MTEAEIYALTLPKLNYYLKQCHEHIEFTVKVSTMGFTSMFGGGGDAPAGETEQREDGEYVEGYKVATAEDMEDFARMLGA